MLSPSRLKTVNIVASSHEGLLLPDGGGVVKSIQNHSDRGVPTNNTNRQVTELVVTGTADNPVLYISSSGFQRYASISSPAIFKLLGDRLIAVVVLSR